MNRPARQIEADRDARGGFTAEDFLAIVDTGVFERIEGKVELIEGVIVRMNPPYAAHSHYQRRLFLELHQLFGEGRDGFIAAFEFSMRIGGDNVCTADVGILRDTGRLEGLFDAGDALLVAEISDTSLARDRGDKRRLYAEAGVPHYWIVDLKGRRIECLADPADGDYRSEKVVAFGDPIPAPGADAEIRLD
ncbi:MAG: Uma2 family endonuclease [Allosphingosinicella sp.]|uniref:Uma2 family endonuclease n=1 Tax=Allosphingosinicella sp. TaxID=2823234 RepID=UPI00392FCDE1